VTNFTFLKDYFYGEHIQAYHDCDQQNSQSSNFSNLSTIQKNNVIPQSNVE